METTVVCVDQRLIRSFIGRGRGNVRKTSQGIMGEAFGKKGSNREQSAGSNGGRGSEEGCKGLLSGEGESRNTGWVSGDGKKGEREVCKWTKSAIPKGGNTRLRHFNKKWE